MDEPLQQDAAGQAASAADDIVAEIQHAVESIGPARPEELPPVVIPLEEALRIEERGTDAVLSLLEEQKAALADYLGRKEAERKGAVESRVSEIKGRLGQSA